MKGKVFIFLLLSFVCIEFSLAQALGSGSVKVHQIADGDVNGLIRAMEEANQNPSADSIVLAESGTYILTKRHSCVTNGFYDYRNRNLPPLPCAQAGAGPVGLPQITRKDWGGKLIINGRGATIKRAESVERFRIFYVWTSGEADFYNLTLENGYANRTLTSARAVISGGAMHLNQRSRVKIQNCSFLNNRASGQGGAIRISAHSDTRLINCHFENNQAEMQGGAVHNVVSPISVLGCTFLNNRSGFQGGGLYSDGADWKMDSSRTVVQDCQFQRNEARFGGGAYLYLYKDQVCVLDGCTFENNGAFSENSLGGGLLLASGDRIVEDTRITEVGNTSEFRVTNCLVLANSSSFLGGGISLARGSFQLINATIALNEVSNLGGGIYFDGSKSVKLVNCTIARNESKNRGGGIVAGNDPSTANTHFEMYNSIIANNTALNNNSRELTVQNNCNLNFLNNANAEQNIEWPAPLNPNNRNDLLCARASSEVLIADPRLGELADNGGKVATMLPQPGSPAIQGGDGRYLPDSLRPPKGKGQIVNIGAFAWPQVASEEEAILEAKTDNRVVSFLFPSPIPPEKENFTLGLGEGIEERDILFIRVMNSFGTIIQETVVPGNAKQITLPSPKTPGLYFISVEVNEALSIRRFVKF